MDTPSAVLYADLRSLGITNREAASVLLSDIVCYGSLPPRFRIDEKSFLSRKVVHAAPQDTPPLADSLPAALTLASRLLKTHANQNGVSALALHYAGDARDSMCAALERFVDAGAASFFRNTVLRINSLSPIDENDRALLLAILFILTGSTGDAYTATRLTESYASRQLGVDFGTLTATALESREEAQPKTMSLALLRIVNGVAKPPLYALSPDSEGTVIGSLPQGLHTIADVTPDVSRNHARIWLEHGIWYVQDLGSTNGTRLISGADRNETVVAAPRKERAPEDANAPSAPVSIRNSDTLCLAFSTSFLIMDATV